MTWGHVVAQLAESLLYKPQIASSILKVSLEFFIAEILPAAIRS